jgi:hypothetical protein
MMSWCGVMEKEKCEEIGRRKLGIAEMSVESEGCDGIGGDKSAGNDSIYVDRGWQAMNVEFTARAARYAMNSSRVLQVLW